MLEEVIACSCRRCVRMAHVLLADIAAGPVLAYAVSRTGHARAGSALGGLVISALLELAGLGDE